MHGKWYRPLDDTTSESLDYGSLAYSRVSDETGIIFGLAIEDRDESIDLIITTEYRINFFVAGLEREINTKKIKCRSR